MGEGGLFGAFWAKHMDYLTIALLMIYVEVIGMRYYSCLYLLLGLPHTIDV